jgi:CHAD domain-containing protein
MAEKQESGEVGAAAREVRLPAQDISGLLIEALAGFRAAMAVAEPAVIADRDIEALHDFRVALRRTRTVLDIVPKPQPPIIEHCRKEVVALARATGLRRDLDLAIAELDRAERESMLDPGTCRPLRAALPRRRALAHGQLLRRFGGRHYRMLLQTWDRLLAAQPGEPGRREILRADADAAVDRAWRRVCRHAGQIEEHPKFGRLHRLRKEVKALRYLLEIFSDLYGRRHLAPLVADLKRLQNALGEVCDIRAQREILEDVAKGAEAALAESSRQWQVLLRRRERDAKGACRKPAARLRKKATTRLSDLIGDSIGDDRTGDVLGRSTG